MGHTSYEVWRPTYMTCRETRNRIGKYRSRIWQTGGGGVGGVGRSTNRKCGAPTYYFGQFSLKIAWEWKNIGPGVNILDAPIHQWSGNRREEHRAVQSHSPYQSLSAWPLKWAKMFDFISKRMITEEFQMLLTARSSVEIKMIPLLFELKIFLSFAWTVFRVLSVISI